MFSRRMLLIAGLIVLFAVTVAIPTITGNSRFATFFPVRMVLYVVSPFQEAAAESIGFVKGIWKHYFLMVSISKDNEILTTRLEQAKESENRCKEIQQSNARLRNLLHFKQTVERRVIAAEVIAKDPTPWYKSIIIDKGKKDGVRQGFPVVVPDGIAGVVTEVSYYHSKVLLIIDQNSALDALVRRTRARGVIQGQSTDTCMFKYVLRKHDIRVGDIVMSSGLDGVFPKGLRVGGVSQVIRRFPGIFQEVIVSPFVDFEKLEEVLVILNPPKITFNADP